MQQHANANQNQDDGDNVWEHGFSDEESETNDSQYATRDKRPPLSGMATVNCKEGDGNSEHDIGWHQKVTQYVLVKQPNHQTHSQ